MKTTAQIKADNPDLLHYRVTLQEKSGDESRLVFDCYAEDESHAYEQAENAYPDCLILYLDTFQKVWKTTIDVFVAGDSEQDAIQKVIEELDYAFSVDTPLRAYSHPESAELQEGDA